MVYLEYKMSERAIWQLVKSSFEDMKNEDCSCRAEKYVHVVLNFPLQVWNTAMVRLDPVKGNIIVRL